MRIAPAKRGAYREIPSWDSPVARYSPLRIRDTRELSRPLSYRRLAAEIPVRDGVARGGWPPSANQLFGAVVTSRPARARRGVWGRERGAPPRAANLKAYHGERQRKRAESRAGKSERRNTLERKGCTVGGNLKERWARERKREGHEGGGKADAWESSAPSGWCSTWHRWAEVEGLWHGYLRAPWAPLAREKFDLLATLYPVADVDFRTRRFPGDGSRRFLSHLFFLSFFFPFRLYDTRVPSRWTGGGFREMPRALGIDFVWGSSDWSMCEIRFVLGEMTVVSR